MIAFRSVGISPAGNALPVQDQCQQSVNKMYTETAEPTTMVQAGTTRQIPGQSRMATTHEQMAAGRTGKEVSWAQPPSPEDLFLAKRPHGYSDQTATEAQ